MATVTFRVVAPVAKLFVDGVALPVSPSASKNLKDGEHSVQWFVRGDPGDAYSVQVVSPPSVARKLDGKIDSSGHDAGTFWILL